MPRDTAWFHEDDYGQIELLPKGSAEFARRQAAEIGAFSEAHRTEDGFWTKAYLRQDAPESLAAIAITVGELEAQALGHLRRFRRVTTGYSSHVEPAENTTAWGSDGVPLVFADSDAAGLVQHVWLGYLCAPDVEALRKFLKGCAERWPLILADWSWGEVIDLCDDAAVVAYLARRTGEH